MRASSYVPPVFNFNRWCHRVAGLLQPEATLHLKPGVTILQDVIVPDTSIYEGTIDIGKMIAAGARGVIPKASQGEAQDPQFRPTWTNARGRLPRGSYHFYDPRHKPSLQVANYVSLLGNDPGELMLIVDWEYGDDWGGSYQGWQNLYTFLEGLKAAMPGRRINIYTGYYYWQDHSPNPITQASSLAYFAQYGLHLAWYTTNFSIVKIPKPWTTLQFLQYSESGPGPFYGTQSGAIDLSAYYGTEEQYEHDFHLGDVIVPPPPTPGGAMQATEKLGKTVTVRSSPHAVPGNSTNEVVAPHATIDYEAIVDDIDFVGNVDYQWLRLGTGRFVNYRYPPNGYRFDLVNAPPPPPDPDDAVPVGVTVHMSDGSNLEFIPKP